MAVTTDKIKERLRALFPKANLSKQRLDAIAAKLAPKPEDEATDDEVDEIINDYNEVIDFVQVAKDDDRIRTLEAARKSKEKPAEKTDDHDDTDDDDESLKSLVRELKNDIASLKAERTQETISQRFNSDPRVKDVPEFIRKGYIPANEEEYEDKVMELSGSFKEYAEKNKIQSYVNDTPGQGNPARKPGQKIKPKTLEDVKDLASTI